MTDTKKPDVPANLSGPPREPDPKYLQMIVKENGKPFSNQPQQGGKGHR